jgi:cysteinyl-tRNA synthetase
VHSRFLLVEGEKMSKSLGNFFTIRDLVLKGHKPSSIRYLLSSVPYRNQLNFTFDGLRQAAESVQRLRNFHTRLTTAQFPAGSSDEMKQLAEETVSRMRASLEDDLNTAQAQAAIFDMVRKANAAADAGQLGKEDVAPLLEALNKFDEIFAVMKDDDDQKIARILEWAKAEGKLQDASKEAIDLANASRLSDADIAGKISQMEQARRSRDFKTSDTIRGELNNAGVIVEITKDGIRWRRK